MIQYQGIPIEEAKKITNDGGGEIYIRQVTSMSRTLEVRERMKKRYKFRNYPDEFKYRCKCIVVFQNLDGVDVILFGLYVYEHDETNAPPNQRAVYVSYLDSVYYMRPRRMRTFVYHELLISYLDYVRAKGYNTAHIWACPPLKGDDYILFAKPEDQKTPKDDRLRQWYVDMLKDCQRRGIVGKVTNAYDLYFSDKKNDASVLPYMEGDYFPAELENIIKDLEEGKNLSKKPDKSGSKKGKKEKKSKTKKAGSRGGTRSAGLDEDALAASGILQEGVDVKSIEAGGRDAVMKKLGETIHPMKESFLVAFLNWKDQKEENKVLPDDIIEWRKKHAADTLQICANDTKLDGIKTEAEDTKSLPAIKEEDAEEKTEAITSSLKESPITEPTATSKESEGEDAKKENDLNVKEEPTAEPLASHTATPNEEKKEEPSKEVNPETDKESTNKSKPDATEEPKLDDTDVSKADATEETKPDVTKESNLNVTKESKPGVTEESKPDVTEGSKPDVTEEPKPVVTEATKQEDTDDSKTDAKEKSKPDVAEESKGLGQDVENSCDVKVEQKEDNAEENSNDVEIKEDSKKESNGDVVMEDATEPEAKKVEPVPDDTEFKETPPTKVDSKDTASMDVDSKPEEETTPSEATAPQEPTVKREGKFAAMEKRKKDLQVEPEPDASSSKSDQATSEKKSLTKDSKGRLVKVIDDDDEELDCEFLNNRQLFLNLCQGNHYQFDQLRRAKHTSMMVLWHLHNRDAPKFVQQCGVCSREILQGIRYHCPTCADYDQCYECMSNPAVPRHQHPLKAIPVGNQQASLTPEQRKERQRSIQLHMTLLMHAATCKSSKCSSANCAKMKGLLKHGTQCQIKAAGGCHVCKRIWALLQIHARQCKQDNCVVPNCIAIRERFRQLNLQQQAMDDRRRQMMNQTYHQQQAR